MTKRKPIPTANSAPSLAAPDKQPYHHGDLRTALIGAALTLIEQHGVKGFTLKDAARIAGVSIAAPYRHFADRDALLGAILFEGFTRFNAALHTAYQIAATPQARILELGVAYVQFALEHPAHFRVMFSLDSKAASFPVPPDDPEDDPDGFSLLLKAVRALYPHATPVQIHDHVLANWSLVHGFALLYLDGSFAATVGAVDPEAQLRRTLALSLSPEAIAPGAEASTGMLNQ